MDPISTARIAHVAWQQRGTFARVLALLIAAPMAMVVGLIALFAGALAVSEQSDQLCAQAAAVDAGAMGSAELATAIAAAPIGSAAQATLRTFAAAAAAAVPAQSFDAAGPYQLPAAYAAGTVTSTGRWHGPVDSAAGTDSRSDAAAATRSVLRRLTRASADWRTVRREPIPTGEAARAELARRMAAVLAAGFTHVQISPAQLAIAFAEPGADAGGTGDTPTGGLLIVGDPSRVEEVAAVIGPRAFAGTVTAQPTSAAAANVSEGADRELSAARGVVVAVVDVAPTSDELEDLLDGTSAQVAVIARRGVVVGGQVQVAADMAALRAAVDALMVSDGADTWFSVCEAVPGLGLEAAAVDPASIIAPDPGAQAALAYALSQVGKPYRSPPSPTSIWDCSSLTAAAWRQAGVRLPAYSYAQAERVQSIPQSAVAPGDLVFWFKGSAHHVALVLSVDARGITIVEAANPRAGVRTRPLFAGDSGSWDRAYFSGFGRITRTTT